MPGSKPTTSPVSAQHFSMVRTFHLADAFTLANGICGALSLFTAATYLLHGRPTDLYLALVLPVFGFWFDVFDGRIARWRKKSSILGQELDSLADSISFGVAPAFLAFTIGLRTVPDMLALTFFISCGIARLARFNATVASLPKDASGKSKFFEGLPIPTSLALVATMSYWVYRGWIQHALPLGSKTLFGAQLHNASLLFVFWGCAMISKSLKVPKL